MPETHIAPESGRSEDVGDDGDVGGRSDRIDHVDNPANQGLSPAAPARTAPARTARAAAVLSAAAASLTAAWAQRAPWHQPASQADVLAGRIDSSATPAAALGIIVSGGVCLLVAAWMFPRVWRRFVAVAAGLGACAATATIAAYSASHSTPFATLLVALASSIVTLVAAGLLWQRQDASRSWSTRYDRSKSDKALKPSSRNSLTLPKEDVAPGSHSVDTAVAETNGVRESAKPAAGRFTDDPWKQLDQGIDPTL